MKQDKLTESAIKEAKPGAKQFKLSDGGGLYLLVHSNGSKYWRFDFRFEGKQKSSSLGVWPEVSLVEARSRRNEAKLKIREGINPIQEKKKKSAQQHEQVWKKENSEERSGPELQQVDQKSGRNKLLNRQENRPGMQSICLNLIFILNLEKSLFRRSTNRM